MQAAEQQTEYERIEKQVIEQLSRYNTIVGRIKILNKQPIGNGMHIEVQEGEDKLQALHRFLVGLPTRMYLTKREQRIEQAANAYITHHPAGISSQLREVELKRTTDENDLLLLKELARKIEKIMIARHGTTDGFEGVLQKVSEIQDLQQEKETIDDALAEIEVHKPHYANLLKLRFIQDKGVEEVSRELNIHRRTFDNWKRKAVMEYAMLCGIAQTIHIICTVNAPSK